jgi:hypothetical protein
VGKGQPFADPQMSGIVDDVVQGAFGPGYPDHALRGNAEGGPLRVGFVCHALYRKGRRHPKGGVPGPGCKRGIAQPEVKRGPVASRAGSVARKSQSISISAAKPPA